jgi:hypothetical protein
VADLFISHVHEDAEVAKALLDFLKESKLEAFLSSDNWQIHAGEKWFERITAELNAAKLVILLLSDQSVKRPWINFEAGWAWATHKTIIPLCIGGLNKGAMPRPYSDLQGLDLRTDYYDLVRDCYFHLYSPGPPYLAPMPFLGTEPHVTRLLRELEEAEKR